MATLYRLVRLQYAAKQNRPVPLDEVSEATGIDVETLEQIEQGDMAANEATRAALAHYYHVAESDLQPHDQTYIILLQQEEIFILRAMLDVAVNYGSAYGKERYDRLYRAVLSQIEEQRAW